MPKTLVITPNELLVLDKEAIIERAKLDPKTLNDSLARLREKHPDSELKTMQLSKLCSLTGKSEEQYLSQLGEFARSLTELRMKTAVEGDELIVQAVNAIDDLNKELNLLTSRIREWYGIIDPVAASDVVDHEKLVNQISKEINTSLFGFVPAEVDKKALSDFALILHDNFKLKTSLESYVEKSMDMIAPNVKALAGGILGARLIAKAGGLRRLALMPGSTIQVLGAEKALFRHLIKGTPSPKHGMIFQHPLISGKSKKLRGRISRSLAAKLSIAARLDYYKQGLNNDLIANFNKRVAEVK